MFVFVLFFQVHCRFFFPPTSFYVFCFGHLLYLTPTYHIFVDACDWLDIQKYIYRALKYAIQKPTGLWQDELTSCVATLKYEDDHDNNNKNGNNNNNNQESCVPPPPLKAAAHHLKIADFQYLLLKARTMVKTRKSSRLYNLRVENTNGQTVDLGPILHVIVDDEKDELYVQDIIEILDAMVGFAGTLATTIIQNTFQDDDDDDEEQEQQQSCCVMGWKMEHEICGDLKQLFEGWESSNKLTAESFVVLCLNDTVPEDEPSERTCNRREESTSSAEGGGGLDRRRRTVTRKRSRRSILPKVAN